MSDTLSSEAPAADLAALEQRLSEASKSGMTTAVWARVKPDAIAIYDPHGTRTFPISTPTPIAWSGSCATTALSPAIRWRCCAATEPSSSRC